MNTKFRRHQKVRLLHSPNAEYIESYADKEIEIKAGMVGKINLLLPNGQYHVEIIQDGETIAYVMADEDQLELVDDEVPDKHEEKAEDWAE
ncbi:hypothetical protein AUJ84_01335 [Candidatus Pacearchaeota archaeon CG1_02_32_132]|nr:MAG: hypothetical protein AUJ84_01335 [Candidatus Pacearchaeota archaeon CG1_02_32_132]